MAQRILGSVTSLDGKRQAAVFHDKARKARPFEIIMSDDGKVTTEYEWTVFDAVHMAERFVKA